MNIIRLFFVILVVLLGCTNDTKLVKDFLPNKDKAIEQIKGAELLHTENGRIKVRMVAGMIKRFENMQPNLIFSDNLEVYFYNDSCQLQSILKSDDASIDEKKNIMIAHNNVELISSDNKRLETEELIWDEKEDKIYTAKKVKITTQKEVVYGEGFTSNSDFTEYSIIKIHGMIDFKSKIN